MNGKRVSVKGCAYRLPKIVGQNVYACTKPCLSPKRGTIEAMHTKKVGKNLYIVDLETCGFKNLISSYVLIGQKAIIIETGPSSSIPNLLKGLKELNVKHEDVAYVALTHVHVDHSGGAGIVLKKLPNAKIVVHSKGVPHLVNPERLWVASKDVLGGVAEEFGEPEPVPEDRILVVEDGVTLDVGEDVRLRVVQTPGHSSHHQSYYEVSNAGVFLGDAAGAYFEKFNEVFPTTPPPFLPDLTLLSLEKLIALNPKALYFSHFGKALNATVRLREHEEQLKLWLRITQEGVRNKESAVQIRNRIFSEDRSIQKIVPVLMANPFDRKTLVENSVRGFIDFVEKQGTI